jgi:hypothetical protein
MTAVPILLVLSDIAKAEVELAAIDQGRLSTQTGGREQAASADPGHP